MYVCVCVSCTYIQKHFGRVYMRKMKGCIYSVEQERERPDIERVKANSNDSLSSSFYQYSDEMFVLRLTFEHDDDDVIE